MISLTIRRATPSRYALAISRRGYLSSQVSWRRQQLYTTLWGTRFFTVGRCAKRSMRQPMMGRAVLLELLLDVPNDRRALLGIGLLRLLVDQTHDQLIAVRAVVARRAAGVVLVEVGVGIVDAEARQVGADEELAAGGHRVPLGGVDLLERRLHADVLEFAEHGRPRHRVGRRLVDGEALGQILPKHGLEHAARLAGRGRASGLGGGGCGQGEHHQQQCRAGLDVAHHASVSRVGSICGFEQAVAVNGIGNGTAPQATRPRHERE